MHRIDELKEPRWMIAMVGPENDHDSYQYPQPRHLPVEPALSKLNLVVNAGERIGIVAANGRGKSTLFRCIAGTLDPTEGDIVRARGLTIGYVEQNVPPALLDRSFYDSVLNALPPEQAESESWRVDVVLESLEVPDELRQRPLQELSGGWQRLAMLARVWATEPDVLLLDEPTNCTAGGMAEWPAPRCARHHIEPRPCLPRRSDESDALSPPGAIAVFCPAL
jgi:energy-coupling factor transporter ATP-binding protein EcfA2